MSSSPSTEHATLSRRDRYRLATTEEIKHLARRQLAERGPGALSLRTIAREMGVVSSALYRYFASHDDLINALCVDAYSSMADAVTDARDAQLRDDATRRWWAICHRYRRWSLDERVDFTLIHGTPVPGYEAPADVTGPAAGRFTGVLLGVFADAVAAGAADPDRTEVPPDLPIGGAPRRAPRRQRAGPSGPTGLHRPERVGQSARLHVLGDLRKSRSAGQRYRPAVPRACAHRDARHGLRGRPHRRRGRQYLNDHH